MTYGWSILIVAVVLGALAYLGVFNPLYFAPKANPGNCQVFRPNGAGTSYDINLLGVCNGEIPKYTAAYNGGSSIISIPLPTDAVYNTVITAWIYSSGNNQCNCGQTIALLGSSGASNGYGEYVGAGYISAGGCTTTQNLTALESIVRWVPCSKTIIQRNKWYNVALVSVPNDGNVIYEMYVDGVDVWVTGSLSLPIPPQQYMLIGNDNSGRVFDGQIANVQLYNTSLDANSIMALYQEGIGGAPIDLQNLVGWWPLNGNANDYSGNGNNGVPTNVVYTSSWISSYNPP